MSADRRGGATPSVRRRASIREGVEGNMAHKKGHKGYEGSAADVRADKREAKKRGVSMKKWEASAADRRMDEVEGGRFEARLGKKRGR